jgi:hypothetical protein
MRGCGSSDCLEDDTVNSVDTEQRSKHGCQGGKNRRNGERSLRAGKGSLLAAIGLVIILGIAVVATHRWWLPHLQVALQMNRHNEAEGQVVGEAANPAVAHDHAILGAPVETNTTSLDLSEQGRKNIGLILETVTVQDFERTIAIPGALVERPGQTKILVSAPMTGIVTRIHPIRGEAVTPGASLFDLRLTHEDLVEKQSSLLRLLEELDVVQREVARLANVTATGAVAGKRLLEQQYEQHKIEAAIRAERQALLLHGLSQEQIQKIVDERQLQQDLTISAPNLDEHASTEEHEDFLQVAEIDVNVGEHVQTGVKLATLTDQCELYIEGRAFEQDADALNRAANGKTEVTAIIEGNGSRDRQVGGLRILHVENAVERESRALKFYVLLPNELVRNELTTDGHRFIGWRFKPGQRVEVQIPVDRWERRIVLPVEAVIEEGPERYVYQEVHGSFQRRSVHVEYRDQRHAVIESDGTLFPGDKVAARGAYQIHLALKNKAGGGSDPHAGHHH